MTRDEAIAVICSEKGLTEGQAEMVIRFTQSMMNRARASTFGIVYPTTQELRSPVYQLFHTVIPHGQYSTPGSAHAAVEDVVLDRSLDEVGIFHDMTRDGADVHCGVQIVRNTI